jgi:hypothetical protein
MLVGVRGFEPPVSTSRTWRFTRLSYTPNSADILSWQALQFAVNLAREVKTLLTSSACVHHISIWVGFHAVHHQKQPLVCQGLCGLPRVGR